MPNSDTSRGLPHKITNIYTQTEDATDKAEGASSNDDVYQKTIAQSFSGNVETAKSFFLHAKALTCFDTCATQIQWALTDDGNGLKVTAAFGMKDPTPDSGDAGWGEIFKKEKDALLSANEWFNMTNVVSSTTSEGVGEDVWDTFAQGRKGIRATESSDHLF